MHATSSVNHAKLDGMKAAISLTSTTVPFILLSMLSSNCEHQNRDQHWERLITKLTPSWNALWYHAVKFL